MMKVYQLLPTMALGDAIGNDTQAIRDFIKEQGYETGIFAEGIDSRLPAGTAESVNNMPELKDEDVLIYHASTGTPLNDRLASFGGKKVIIYHNITPPQFFREYSPIAVRLTMEGYKGIQHLAEVAEYCIADSEYNREDLLKMGYQCPIDVCPIMIPFDDYDQKPDQSTIERYSSDGWTNLLFVGRIAPNKCQQDIIRAFYAYQKVYNPKSRLFLVGNSGGMEVYEKRLKEYALKLGIEDKVIFTEHIKFNQILAYYHLADAFVCMSEHEGFCVPIVEAMYFKKPIVAYSSTAVPETMGKGGLLLDSKDPVLVAGAIHQVVTNDKLKKYIQTQQEEELKRFRYEGVKEKFLKCLHKVL